jgi:transposase
MLSQTQRSAILELNGQGVSKREIARVLKLSRLTIRKVLRSNSSEVPTLSRPEKAEPYRQQILEQWSKCKGNLVRVQEELAAQGATFSYQALTAFCRRHGIGQPLTVAAGQYHFAPGEELQHDTSPHEVVLGGKRRKVQTASAVLCYSRMLFFQLYPTFQRFDCKVFLTEALRYFGGAPVQRVMIDNTHVVVLRGTGSQMVPVAEMAAFAERFGFRFQAHERGDANRSGRVERPFHFIEHNFLAGRSFSSWEELNQQARQWCDRVNATYKKHVRAVPRELFVLEQSHLRPLPVWIPEVYRLHERTVDVEGYVALHCNRYSVPISWIGRRVEVRESKDKVEIQLDARHLVTHRRVAEAEHQRVMLPQHRAPWGQGAKRSDLHLEQEAILKAVPEIAEKKRQQFLNDHRTWTSSAKLEVLFQKNLLNNDVYGKLDQARKARNDFAHRGAAPSQEVALIALTGAFEFASLCASDFKDATLFEQVITLATSRCHSELYPEKREIESTKVNHWLALPPLPGDKTWGDQPYEVIEDLCLKPLGQSSS